jgi:hypothetical protein
MSFNEEYKYLHGIIREDLCYHIYIPPFDAREQKFFEMNHSLRRNTFFPQSGRRLLTPVKYFACPHNLNVF